MVLRDASASNNCFPLIWGKQRIRRSNDMKTILRALTYSLPRSLIWSDKCPEKIYFASGASKSMHIVSSSVWRKEYYQDIVCFPIDILSWFVVKPSGESNHVWSEPSDRWCPSDDVGLHRLRFRFRPRADLIFDHCGADRWPTSSSEN